MEYNPQRTTTEFINEMGIDYNPNRTWVEYWKTRSLLKTLKQAKEIAESPPARLAIKYFAPALVSPVF